MLEYRGGFEARAAALFFIEREYLTALGGRTVTRGLQVLGCTIDFAP